MQKNVVFHVYTGAVECCTRMRAQCCTVLCVERLPYYISMQVGGLKVCKVGACSPKDASQEVHLQEAHSQGHILRWYDQQRC